MGQAQSAVKLMDHSAKAAGLFNNMRVPATVMAGSIVPLGFLSPVPSTGDENLNAAIQRFNVVVATTGLCSELIAVMYSSVALNKLTETNSAPAESVMALLMRDCEVAWLGTNVCFLLGLMCAVTMVGLRAWIMTGRDFGVLPASLTMAALLVMTSIINDGISAGDGEEAGLRFGADFMSLVMRFGQCLLTKILAGTNPLLAVAGVVAAGGTSIAVLRMNAGGRH